MKGRRRIYFSCLLVKRLAIYSDEPLDGAWQLEAGQFKELLNDSLNVSDKLFIRFNTVMTKMCPVDDYIGPPPKTFSGCQRWEYNPNDARS